MNRGGVAVVGGGIAGTAAALRCAAAGAEVTLIESRPRLGGAAYSFVRDGLRVDNGQHVFLRCCTAYRGFLEELDAGDMVTLQPRLEIAVLGPGGRRSILRRSSLPAPLQLAGSLARFGFLSAGQRLRAARAMAALRRVDYDDPEADQRSFGAWLREHGQDEQATEALWELIVRPTINLRAADASLAQAAQVFQVGLLRGRAAADVGYARAPLSEIHDAAAQRALERAGVAVRLRTGITALEPVPGGFKLELAGGSSLSAEAVVLAVPPARAAKLLPPEAGVDAGRLSELGTSPIVNLHVVYDRRVMEEPFAAGVGTPVQWVFDRTEGAGLEHGQYLAVSLSAADAELGLGADELRKLYLPALAELFPRAAGATVEGFFVTREHAATFRAAPGARSLRPGARTRLSGLALAGSWTDTGWPATMEGAVRSGQRAAALVLEATGAAAGLRVLAPLRLEARAVRAGAPRLEVERTGLGPRRAARAARRAEGVAPVLVMGFCGALDPELRPGDVVLASELRGPAGPVPCADPAILAGVLRRGGLRVHVGPLVSSPRLVTGHRRGELAASGAIAVDMESAWLVPPAGTPAPTILRVVLDTPGRELLRPLRTVIGTAIAYRSLKRAAGLLGDWACAFGTRDVVLASPRASCAGVDRAVEIVERALEAHGPPVYVRKQIVHNTHVIAGLECRGAVFVDELDEVPPGSTLIFSAHGVSPAVRSQARARRLAVLDATCPLVAKVHAEARRFAGAGLDVVLVGHAEHEEVQGTFGEAPECTHVIDTAEEVGQLQVRDPRRVAYLTQTTLAVDETAEIVEELRARFPTLKGPRASDICYATQNRQDAVRATAENCSLMLVVGSQNSSNSQRLVEVAERSGCRARLIECAGDIDPAWLTGARRIGLSAGASAPEALVEGVLAALGALGPVAVSELSVASEDVRFRLPAGLGDGD